MNEPMELWLRMDFGTHRRVYHTLNGVKASIWFTKVNTGEVYSWGDIKYELVKNEHVEYFYMNLHMKEPRWIPVSHESNFLPGDTSKKNMTLAEQRASMLDYA